MTSTEISGMRIVLQNMLRISMVLSTFLVSIVSFEPLCYAQSYFSERNDEAYLILALKKQKARYDVAKTEYTTALELRRRKLISNQDFEQIRANHVNADITYQQAMLR